MFFRTITSDALQGTAAAKYAIDQGFKKIAVIHVNNDFGVNMLAEFAKAYKALGGEIVSVTPYNEKQSSYDAEASKGIAAKPDGLYLIATPVDGATIARAWISQGGPAKFLLNDGMNSPDFITSVGAKYLNDAYGTSSGTSPTASTEYFNANYKAFSGGIDPSNPAADRSYDAGAIVGLAIAAAPTQDPIAIRDAIFKVTSKDGEAIHAGKAEFAKALDLLKAGKPIRYEGVIGPVSFDQYGDITGPFRLWKIADGEVTTVGRDFDRRRQRDQSQDRRSKALSSRREPPDRAGALADLATEFQGTSMANAPPRISLAPGLEISRIVTGLWQVADMERDGRELDREAAVLGPARLRARGIRHVRHGRSLWQRRTDRRPHVLGASRRANAPARRARSPSPNGARRRGR